jgi:hemerythrin
MTFEWTPELAVGVEAIDEQHRELFRRTEVFLQAAQASAEGRELLRLLGYLGEYVVTHFEAEEALMAELAYPSAAAHTAEHARFTREFVRMRDGFARAGPDAELVARVRREVCDWVIRHVTEADRQLAAFVRGSGERAGAVARVEP